MSKKFSDLTQLTTPATNDIVPVDDVSAGSTKYITISDLVNTPGAINPGALSTGSAWAWTAYTPTWPSNTIGNSVVDAAYSRLGQTVRIRISLTVGSTSNFALGPFVFSLPVAPLAGLNTVGNDGFFFGTTKMLNPGVQAYTGVLKFVPGGNNCVFIAHRTDAVYATYAQVTNTVPFAVASGSIYMAIAEYEAA